MYGEENWKITLSSYVNAYLFSEKTRDSLYDKQCLHSFPKPVEQIKLPHEAHTKAFSSS